APRPRAAGRPRGPPRRRCAALLAAPPPWRLRSAKRQVRRAVNRAWSNAKTLPSGVEYGIVAPPILRRRTRMDQRGISHRLTSVMTSKLSGALSLAVVTGLAQQLGLATPALGQVSLRAFRTELLYAQSANVDCSMLHKITDASQLPFYV